MEIRFFTKEGWQENQFHYHDQLEILLIMSEGGQLFVRNTSYPITRGSLFILNSNDLHRSVPKPQALYQFYSIRFYPEEAVGMSATDFDLLHCYYDHERFHHRVQLGADQIDHLLKLINKAEYYLGADCSAYGKEIFMRTLLAEILVYINFLYRDTEKPAPERTSDGIEKMLPVIVYIQENLARELSLDELSRQFFVSKYYLSHQFRKVMGLPISEYIIKRRLAKAKTLLRQGLSVSAAGEQAGWRSNSHFIRSFSKAEGVSPKQYVKQYPALGYYASPSPMRHDVFI